MSYMPSLTESDPALTRRCCRSCRRHGPSPACRRFCVARCTNTRTHSTRPKLSAALPGIRSLAPPTYPCFLAPASCPCPAMPCLQCPTLTLFCVPDSWTLTVARSRQVQLHKEWAELCGPPIVITEENRCQVCFDMCLSNQLRRTCVSVCTDHK